jgi:uncharacterized protein YkwD
MSVILLLTILSSLSLPLCALDLDSSDRGSIPAKQHSTLVQEQFVLREINRIRGQHGLAKLKLSDDLQIAARSHSANMAASGHFSHTDRAGRGLSRRLSKIQESRFIAGENIQCNDFPDPARTAVQGWLESPGHLKNILTEKFTETGVGVAVDPEGLTFFTQIFLGR